MVDRVWWMWQNQKPLERAFLIHGTQTFLNQVPSPNATVEDNLIMGWVAPKDAPPSAAKHHVSSVAGPYCYIYA